MASKSTLVMVLAALHGMNHALQVALPPLFLAIQDELGISGLGPVMAFGTVYFAVYGVMNLPYGFMVDRFSKKKVLALGSLINALAFVLAGLAPSYGVFMVAMVLAGLGGGAYHPAANAIIAGIFKDRLGRALGLVGSGAALGLAAGPALAGYLGEMLGWRYACLALAGLGILVSLLFWLNMPAETPRHQKQAASPLDLRALLAPTLLVITIFSLREFSLWGVKLITAPMSQMNLGFSSHTAGLLVGGISVMGIISQPVGGTLSDRLGRGSTVFWSLMAAGPLFVLLPHLGPVLVFPAALVAGLFLFATVPVVEAAAADAVPEEGRGRVFGLMLTAGILIGALSPYLMGFVFDQTGSYLLPYLALGCVALGAGLLALRLPRKKQIKD
jgi:MFS family permease